LARNVLVGKQDELNRRSLANFEGKGKYYRDLCITSLLLQERAFSFFARSKNKQSLALLKHCETRKSVLQKFDFE